MGVNVEQEQLRDVKAINHRQQEDRNSAINDRHNRDRIVKVFLSEHP